jgi:methylated-DNA-[protein]-cysteine S-methyltransferase
MLRRFRIEVIGYGPPLQDDEHLYRREPADAQLGRGVEGRDAGRRRLTARSMPEGAQLHRRTCTTPFGVLTLVGSSTGLRHVLWEASRAPGSSTKGGCRVLDEAERQLRAYFAGQLRSFDLTLDLVGTEFQLEAWRALAGIPYGTTVSYGEQARRLGRPAAARAVGAANGRNPVPIVLPCHRLVSADGALVGFGGGIARKRLLLEHESRVRVSASRGDPVCISPRGRGTD